MDRTKALALATGLLLLGLVLGYALWPSSDEDSRPQEKRSELPSELRQQLGVARNARSEALLEDEEAPQGAPVPREPDPELDNKLAQQIVTEADEAFERADLETATELFLRIVERYPDTAMAPYAAYKLAWCRLNEGDRTEAIRSMELLTAWLESGEVAGGEALAREARKDLEMFRTMDDEPPEGTVLPDEGAEEDEEGAD